MKSKKTAALVVGVMTAGTIAGGASAAFAGAQPSDCHSGWVCIYDNAGYGNQLGWRSAGFSKQDISSGNNDKMSSWANNSSKNAAWFTDAKEQGDCHTMAANSNNYSLDIFSGNDAASSWQGQGC